MHHVPRHINDVAARCSTTRVPTLSITTTPQWCVGTCRSASHTCCCAVATCSFSIVHGDHTGEPQGWHGLLGEVSVGLCLWLMSRTLHFQMTVRLTLVAWPAKKYARSAVMVNVGFPTRYQSTSKQFPACHVIVFSNSLPVVEGNLSRDRIRLLDVSRLPEEFLKHGELPPHQNPTSAAKAPRLFDWTYRVSSDPGIVSGAAFTSPSGPTPAPQPVQLAQAEPSIDDFNLGTDDSEGNLATSSGGNNSTHNDHEFEDDWAALLDSSPPLSSSNSLETPDSEAAANDVAIDCSSNVNLESLQQLCGDIETDISNITDHEQLQQRQPSQSEATPATGLEGSGPAPHRTKQKRARKFVAAVGSSENPCMQREQRKAAKKRG
jgi:hypothetical protein